MEDPETAATTLAELRGLGVQIAIDDFGSEYSSLAYLKRFPVSTLKIDKSFVDSLAREDSPDATLIATIVAMAQALGITTVAEGVETRLQADRLIELGCDSAQGYLYSRPVGLRPAARRSSPRWALSGCVSSQLTGAAGERQPAASERLPRPRPSTAARSSLRTAGSSPSPRTRIACRSGSSAASRRSASSTSHQAAMAASEPRYRTGAETLVARRRSGAASSGPGGTRQVEDRDEPLDAAVERRQREASGTGARLTSPCAALPR